MKIAWNNCYSIADSDVVLFGVSSSSGSLYKGTQRGPDEIRSASQKWFTGETLEGKKFVLQPFGGIRKKIYDSRNIEKKDISKFVEKISSLKKVPAMLGGDHSNTLEALTGVSRAHKSFSVLYFDSHLDLVPGQGMFYGSVFLDASKLKPVKLSKSACVGCRTFRESELEQAKKKKLLVLPAHEVEELGVRKTFNKVKKKLGKKVYLSVDIDVVDPSSAPGVSDPVPAGLTPLQLTSLARLAAKLKLVGFDIVETSPSDDRNGQTVNLSAKLFSEIIAGMR